MKASGILSIIGVIAAFAAFSPDANAKCRVNATTLQNCPGECLKMDLKCKGDNPQDCLKEVKNNRACDSCNSDSFAFTCDKVS